MNEERGENFFIELLKIAVPVILIVVVIRVWIAQPFIVSGLSMDPTFDTGQYLLIDELTYHFNEPERGDVIIFKYPKDPKQYFIKRIIGLPGETLTITNADVAIVRPDGTREYLKEPYLVHVGNGAAMTVTLGQDEYFVMGDNRTDSSDSRFWGELPRQNIIGRALVRLFPVSKLGLFPGKANIQFSNSNSAANAMISAPAFSLRTHGNFQFSMTNYQ
jgi:signal peptidase I